MQEDTLAEEIEQCMLQRLGRHTVQNEFMSWVNSYNYMYKVLSDPGIPENAGVAIEYNIPQTAKRVDFMISGYDAENHPDMVIVELKQWSSLEKVAQSETLVETFVGGSNRRVVHPSYQAWSYAQLISDYNASVQDAEIQLDPCSYPGCSKLTDKRICEEHEKLSNSNYEKYGRDKSTKKRYGRAWKRIRDKYAAEHPFCEMCFEREIIVPTEEIHHKLPLSEGGTHDRSNLIALCKLCHSTIHAERGDYWGNQNHRG